MNKKKRYFSLIELLVVIAIIAVLAGLLAPALTGARDKAKGMACKNNLKQIHLLLANYETDNSGIYPYAENITQWGDPTGWTNLITPNNSDRHIYRCPNEKKREFSYSLNCREVYLQRDSFGSWTSAQLGKMTVPPSSFIIVEESDSYLFMNGDCDQDNYTQNVNSFMEANPKHKTGAPLMFIDGHADSARYFDDKKMTYFTTEMKGWE